MNFFTAAALFAAVVVAHPLEHRSSDVCPAGLFSNPQCCSALVLDAVGLDCYQDPTITPPNSETVALRKAAQPLAAFFQLPAKGFSANRSSDN
ncbi:hypothetical protein TrVFT333_001806 [Trichoderma virens FT-333]|nr:hypothetical protein TrVFT333_001806 [Trichoderma virens FT-333]